jgi:hypothetical protein
MDQFGKAAVFAQGLTVVGINTDPFISHKDPEKRAHGINESKLHQQPKL